MNHHLWFHNSEINDTSNNILLYRCKIQKLGEENGSIIEMHKSKEPRMQAYGREPAWEAGAHGRVLTLRLFEEPGAQAPSSTPNLDDSVIIISFKYSLPKVFFFLSLYSWLCFFPPLNS